MKLCIQTPNQILSAVHHAIKKVTQKFYKDGIELEKGAIITERRIKKNSRQIYVGNGVVIMMKKT